MLKKTRFLLSIVLFCFSLPLCTGAAFNTPAFFACPPFSGDRWESPGRSLNSKRLSIPGRLRPHRAVSTSMAASSVEKAIEMCRSNPKAVIVTVWPTANSQVEQARKWIEGNKANIVYEGQVPVKQEAAVPCVMALYYGEDWLESNCWYMESPLPTGPPDPPHAGAKWKAALAFTRSAPIHIFVVDARSASSLWSSKYSIRERLRQAVGSLGNSCLHLTDDQAQCAALRQRGRGVPLCSTEESTEEPTEEPTEESTKESTEEPTEEPTEESTIESTEEPTEESTEAQKNPKKSLPLTDATQALAAWRGGEGVSNAGGYACDSSYAFHCARVLLNPHSVAFLNSCDIAALDFVPRFEEYCRWLSDPLFEDVINSPSGMMFQTPPGVVGEAAANSAQ